MPTGAPYDPQAPPPPAEFRATFPAFAAADDDTVEAAVRLAADLYAGTRVAVLHLAAHVLALASQETAAADGGAGVITAEGIGSRRATYRAQGTRPGDAWYEQSAYGRTFLALRAADPNWAVYAAVGE